ncbi:MAG: adenylyltransferase/cytidyltransferase family protein [Candidatus Liptonbacteria bacterium]|nr:adenylyltransferase/cytidyltransferase family protein [Parcubacteria group bacterium]MBI4087364.1 adenylyltransferase/cytidyltransferase family protein [Candidatus Liptonbacteria bacterium]
MRKAKDKIKTLAQVVEIAELARSRGLKVVTQNGCFDLIHVGHTQNLEWCKSQGDILIVGVNSDRSVKTHKGESRPILPEKERALALASLESVDYVFIFDTDSPIPWIREIKPSIHVKGRGAETHPLFEGEKNAVEEGGGRVMLAPLAKGRSTTGIVETILKNYGEK